MRSLCCQPDLVAGLRRAHLETPRPTLKHHGCLKLENSLASLIVARAEAWSRVFTLRCLVFRAMQLQTRKHIMRCSVYEYVPVFVRAYT